MAVKKTVKRKSTQKTAAKKKPQGRHQAEPRSGDVPFTERILDCLKSPDPEDDWRFGHLEEAGISFPDLSDLPKEVDLRQAWWTVSDQQASGSCVGWALADSVLRWHFVRAGRLPQDQPLSPRFLWMAAKETDAFTDYPQSFIETAGTSLKAAIKVADKYGCVPDDVLPFHNHRLYQGSTISFYRRAREFRIRSYTRLVTLREWRRWLAKDGKGPILIRVEVDKTWHQVSSSGRLDEHDPYPPGSGLGGGHAAAVVGYTAAGNFIIRNSWGTGWGRDGFAFGSPLYMDQAVTEAYGIDI